MLLEFTLSFTENQWVCTDNKNSFYADSLDEIDLQITNYLDKEYTKGTFRIKMFFDFERFPKWHRQYMSHYFNRDYNYTIS